MNEVIKEVLLSGKRLTPDGLDALEDALQNGLDTQLLLTRIKKLDHVFISREDIDQIVSELEKTLSPVVVKRSDFHPIAKDYSPNLRILKEHDITNNSRTTGSVENFVHYFRDRFNKIYNMLKSRPSDVSVIDIKYLKKHRGERLRVIGMINEISYSKKGNLLVRCEDLSDEVLVVIPKNTNAYGLRDTLLEDEVVMFEGKMTERMFIADEIIRPETPLNKEVKKIEDDLAIAYISDIHIGSDMFLEEVFKKFILWLNGKGDKHRELAGKVKYLVIAGDVVDGIGVYPEQEDELTIKDIFKQYEAFDEFMEDIPDYITIIVSPGNHDAVRRAEPQPALPQDLVKSNVIRVGNPSWLEIEGLLHLIYHGRGLDIMASSIPGLTYTKPTQLMKEMLIRRHLSPTYGKNLIIPEEQDYLVIHEVPDVFHSGHIHTNGYELYRGVHLINSGTFQGQTSYQVKLGHVPTPGIVPVLELKTGLVHQVKFVQDNPLPET